MKYESLLLRSLFAACLIVSGLIVGSMLFRPIASTQLAGPAQGAAATTAQAPSVSSCALPPDGVVCPLVKIG